MKHLVWSLPTDQVKRTNLNQCEARSLHWSNLARVALLSITGFILILILKQLKHFFSLEYGNNSVQRKCRGFVVKNDCGAGLTCVGVTQTETTFQVSCQWKMSNVLQIIALGWSLIWSSFWRISKPLDASNWPLSFPSTTFLLFFLHFLCLFSHMSSALC